MKRNIITWIVCLVLSMGAKAQCDTNLVPNTNFTILSVSSQHNSFHAINAIDGDTTTAWKSGNASFPHELVLDLGQAYNLNGIGIMSKTFGTINGKLKDFELYISSDTANWGNAEIAPSLTYQSNTSIENKKVYFGAVAGRYVKFRALSNVHDGDTSRLFISELSFYKDSCQASGKHNQAITFTAISKKTTTDSPFSLTAFSNSGLPLSFQVVSGPASVQGDTLSLSGVAGKVVVKAIQSGDSNFYPAEKLRSFHVIDLSTYYPSISTLLSDSFPIEMSGLKAFPIYSTASISEASFLSVDTVKYSINGSPLSTQKVNGKWVALWYPSAYGNYTLQASAMGSNGNITTESYSIEVTDQIADRTVNTFDDVLINFGTTGQWHTSDYELPQFVGAYDQIIAHLDFDCPNISGGCDDWDRLAYIMVKGPDGDWKELIRYITPYGVACSHSLDVTAFASLLQGKVSLRVFVQTYGTGGWEISLDLEYKQGTPQYTYSSVETLWQGSFNFGNPAKLQPLDTMVVNIDNQIQAAELRLVNTGHGWGANNSQNAAEFYNATHQLKIDNQLWYNQNLWNQCNPNPDGCTGQLGSWHHPRAGWCPGAISQPFEYDLSAYIGTGDFDLAYIFDPSYQDYCHPNNPNCVTGVTCSDCNAGSNPNYRIGAYVIRYSNQPIIQTPQTSVDNLIKNEFTFEVYPNPSSGLIELDLSSSMEDCNVFVYHVDGSILKRYLFSSSKELNNAVLDLSDLSSGVYFVSIQTSDTQATKKIIIQ